jgi:hypothetical protein
VRADEGEGAAWVDVDLFVRINMEKIVSDKGQRSRAIRGHETRGRIDDDESGTDADDHAVDNDVDLADRVSKGDGIKRTRGVVSLETDKCERDGSIK